jgi:hypothetical protein
VPPMNAGRARLIVGFVLMGGIGIPLFFAALWALTRASLAGNADALYEVWGWIEAFRVMLWPSSIFIVARSAGDTAGEMQDVLIAILGNIGVYALLGGATAFAFGNRIAEVVLVIIVLVLVYAINVYWSNHLASFVIAAAIVTVLFVALFRRLRRKGQNAGA